MKVYQAFYMYNKDADPHLYFGGQYGSIYTSKEEAEKEAKYMKEPILDPECCVDLPEKYIIQEIEVKEKFIH